MESAVGQALIDSPRRKQRALILAVAAVTADFLIVTFRHDLGVRLALALIAFALLVALNRGDLSSLGLLARPRQGWRWWILTSLTLGAIVVLCLVLGLGIWVGLGNELPIYTTPPTQILSNFLHMCVVSPVLEETIYRAIVCIPLVAWAGCWRTIAVCGVLFAALHVAYGNPSPENLVGGFLLAWVYLKSETILLPVLLHSLGNFVVLVTQVAGWYLLN